MTVRLDFSVSFVLEWLIARFGGLVRSDMAPDRSRVGKVVMGEASIVLDLILNQFSEHEINILVLRDHGQKN